MRLLIFLLYLAVEVAAFWAMAHYLGVVWAILITVAASAVGVVLLGRRGRAVFSDLGKASRSEISSAQPLTDTALLALSGVLTVIPGVVTTGLGMLLMLRPIRRLLTPLVALVTARRVSTLVGGPGLRPRVVVDGTVVDGTVVDEGTNPAGSPTGRDSAGEGSAAGRTVVDGVVEGEIVDADGPDRNLDDRNLDDRRLPPGAG